MDVKRPAIPERIRSTAWLLSSYLARAGSQALLFWSFASVSGAAGAGEFALAFAVSTPVFMLCDLGLRNVIQTLAVKPSFGTFLGVRVASSAVAFAVVLAVALSPLLNVAPSIIIFLAIMKFADSVSDICHGRLQALGAIRRVAQANWANAAGSTIAIVAVTVFTRNATWALVSSAIASAVVALGLCYLSRDSPEHEMRSSGGIRAAVRLLKVGLPLGVAQCLVAALVYMPVIFLGYAGTQDQVGVFAACQYSLTFANLFFSAVMQTWLSPLSSSLSAGGVKAYKIAHRHYTRLILGLGLGSGAAIFLLMPTALTTLFGGDFRIDPADSLIFAVASVALAAEYVVTATLLVRNSYRSPFAMALFSLLITGLVALLMSGRASVTTAAFLCLLGILGRVIWGAAVLTLTRRHSLGKG